MLTPTRVELESTFKSFGLEKGTSEGSTLRVEFAVPPGLSPTEFKRALGSIRSPDGDRDRLRQQLQGLTLGRRGSSGPSPQNLAPTRAAQHGEH